MKSGMLLLTLGLAVTPYLAACERDEGPMEKTGEKLDETGEKLDKNLREPGGD